MITKICLKCKIEKPLSEFWKNKNTKDGFQVHCKQCIKEYQKDNKEKIVKYQKSWRDNNQEKLKKYRKNHYQENKEIILENCAIYRSNNIEKRNQYQKEFYKTHKDYCKQYNKEYRIKKKDILKIKSIIYAKKRRKENIQVRLKDSLSSRLRLALKGLCKSSSTMILIGCEIDYLMYYIQERFTDGMSWDNYGDWHIDHIKPCIKFDLSKESEQRACFNYTNLQPLWAIDNLRKGSKYGKS